MMDPDHLEFMRPRISNLDRWFSSNGPNYSTKKILLKNYLYLKNKSKSNNNIFLKKKFKRCGDGRPSLLRG